MTSRKRTLPCLALLVVGGCASLSDRAGSDLAGCYQFRVDADTRALGLPWGVELVDEPLEEGWLITTHFDDVRKARTATSATGREDHPFGYWRLTPEDSVELGHPAGGAGFTLVLAREGQDLEGNGRAVGDAVPPGAPTGAPAPRPVLAYRVLCGAP